MLKDKNPKILFFDGSFGTYYNKIKNNNDICELANLSDKNTVFNIHKEYLDVGVNAIKTNSFGVNSLLSDDPQKIEDIIKNGYEIATSAVNGTDAIVFADIGYINSDEKETEDEYVALSNCFIECGAKNFLFETFPDYDVLIPVLEYIKKTVPDCYIIVSFAVSQDGYTKKGHYYNDLISIASKNVDVVGLNCICGPNHLYNLIKELDLTNIKFSAMPNSGYPTSVNGRTVFFDNAKYFSQKLADIYGLGVTAIGGCCGTTPEHIRYTLEKISKLHQVNIIFPKEKAKETTTTVTINSFKEKLEENKEVIAVELDPPLDTDCSYIISAAKKAKLAGADIITIADSPLARTRAESIILAAKIKREVGIEVIPHLSCRDRNHIGIKSSLIGANIEDINNILVITGDPVALTDRGSYKGVFSFNSFELISFIHSLNIEVFSNSPFYIGGALNINTSNFESELDRAKKKIDNNAKLLLTQPIFTDTAVENLSLSRKSLDCKILTGILPVAGYKNALFLKNEVTGIDIPESLLDLLKDKTIDESNKISIDFCMNMVKKTIDICDGYYLITPLKKIDLVCDLLKKIRSLY